ncbi:hypothetical protein JOM56_004597 [Amanita muscaria]
MNTGEDDIPENNNTGSTHDTTSPPLPPTPPFDFSQLIQGPLTTQLMQWIAQQRDSSNGGPRPISSSTATVNPGQATEPPALNLPRPRPVTASRRATTNDIRAESPLSEVPDSEGEDQAAEATRMKNLKRAKENTGRGSKTCDILVVSKTGIWGRLAEPYKPYQTGEALQGTTSLQGSTWPGVAVCRLNAHYTYPLANFILHRLK